MWVSSFKDFLQSDVFDRDDILRIILLLKLLVVNLFEEMIKARQFGRNFSMLDEFVLSVCSALLHILFEYFAMKEYIDSSKYDRNYIDWSEVNEDRA